MTRSTFHLAALGLCAGLLFTSCTGCAPAAPASSGAPAGSAAESTLTVTLPDPLPEPIQPTEEDLAAITDVLETRFRVDWDRPGRYLTARLDSVQVIPPKEWAGLQIPLTDNTPWLDGRSWMDCITDPGGCLLMAQTTTEYTPETLISGPQYSDGVTTHMYLAVYGANMEDFEIVKGAEGFESVEGAEGWIIADQWGYYTSSELPEPSPDPAQEELDLTRAQWLMLQHQTRALALSGIFRDLDDPLQELTPAECAWYLYARSESWFGLTDEGRTQTPSSIIFQADFTAENGVWAADWRGGGPCMPKALKGPEEVLPAQNPDEETIRAALDADPNAIVYERTGDTVTATLTLPLESGTIAMDYTFGLVPDSTGPVSRTYLQSARRV